MYIQFNSILYLDEKNVLVLDCSAILVAQHHCISSKNLFTRDTTGSSSVPMLSPTGAELYVGLADDLTEARKGIKFPFSIQYRIMPEVNKRNCLPFACWVVVPSPHALGPPALPRHVSSQHDYCSQENMTSMSKQQGPLILNSIRHSLALIPFRIVTTEKTNTFDLGGNAFKSRRTNSCP